MVRVEEVKQKLQQCDPDRFEFPYHVHERAMQRNVDLDGVKQKLQNMDLTDVRENNTTDPQFEFSYRVIITVNGERYEMPIYFNVPGTKVLVKSIWPR